MLTPEKEKRIEILERKLGIAPSSSYDHNYKQEYLTRPTEESYLKQIGRLAAQIPRGVAKGVAELADIPYAAYSLATKREMPKESLGEKTRDFLDKHATWSAPGGSYGKGLQNLTSDLVGLKGMSRAGKIASKAGAKRVGSILHQPGHTPLVSTAGSSLATSVERDDPHHKNAGLGISSLMGSFSANAALKAGKGAYSAWKTAKNLQNPDYLKNLDKLPLQAIESYKKRTSDQYNALMTPIEKEIADKKGKVSLQGVIAPLEEKLNQFKSYQGRKDFLETTEGQILETLWKHPKEVSYSEAEALKKLIQKKADSLGAFEPHKTGTGRDLAAIDSYMRKALEDSVGKHAPDSLENYKAAKALWADRMGNKMPLIEHIEREGMVPSKAFHNSLKESKENAAHARFILDNLEGEDKKKYALDVIKSGALKKAGLPHTKSGFLKSLPELIQKRPHHHQVFYEAIGEKNLSPLGRALTPRSVSVINALKAPLKDPYERHNAAREARIRELEEKLGISPHAHAQGGAVSKPNSLHQQLEAIEVRGERYKQELAHFNRGEMKALKKTPGLIKDETEKFKKIARQGRGGDTEIGEINQKTARLLDQLIHHGHKEVNPRTGLREYVRGAEKWLCPDHKYNFQPSCPKCDAYQKEKATEAEAYEPYRKRFAEELTKYDPDFKTMNKDEVPLVSSNEKETIPTGYHPLMEKEKHWPKYEKEFIKSIKDPKEKEIWKKEFDNRFNKLLPPVEKYMLPSFNTEKYPYTSMPYNVLQKPVYSENRNVQDFGDSRHFVQLGDSCEPSALYRMKEFLKKNFDVTDRKAVSSPKDDKEYKKRLENRTARFDKDFRDQLEKETSAFIIPPGFHDYKGGISDVSNELARTKNENAYRQPGHLNYYWNNAYGYNSKDEDKIKAMKNAYSKGIPLKISSILDNEGGEPVVNKNDINKALGEAEEKNTKVRGHTRVGVGLKIFNPENNRNEIKHKERMAILNSLQERKPEGYKEYFNKVSKNSLNGIPTSEERLYFLNSNYPFIEKGILKDFPNNEEKAFHASHDPLMNFGKTGFSGDKNGRFNFSASTAYEPTDYTAKKYMGFKSEKKPFKPNKKYLEELEKINKVNF